MHIIMYGKGKVGRGVQSLCISLGIECVLMDDQDRDDTSLQEADYVVMTPGIPPIHTVYALYKDKILSELSFVAVLEKEKLLSLSFSSIGITGTNGKSTTSFILYQAAKSLLSDSYDVYLAGNTEDSFSSILVSLLDRSSTKPIIFVLEVSSFMLYNLQNFVFDVGVFINISQDHLDWHGTMKHYWESKYTMVSHSISSVIGQSLVDKVSLNDAIKVTDSISIPNPNLLGNHNQENLSVAYTALKVFMEKHDISYTDRGLKDVFSTVVGMPHRLEKKLIGNVVFIDDAISTSEHSLLTALRSLHEDVILVVGGYDNDERYEQLLGSLGYVSKAIIYGSNKEVFSSIFKKKDIEYYTVSTLKDAIQKAFVLAQKDNLSILYSPGSKSFDQFTNVYHRIETLDSLLGSMSDYLQRQ